LSENDAEQFSKKDQLRQTDNNTLTAAKRKERTKKCLQKYFILA
jgi:hypothetical protein